MAKRLRRRGAVKAFEHFNEMRLIVITGIEEWFMLPQMLCRRRQAQQVLKAHHVAEGFGGIADIALKKPAELSRAEACVQRGFYGHRALFFQNKIKRFVKPAVGPEAGF